MPFYRETYNMGSSLFFRLEQLEQNDKIFHKCSFNTITKAKSNNNKNNNESFKTVTHVIFLRCYFTC